MSRKILITGGAGFIGSTIADTFLAAGWDVAVIDDLSSGKRENVPARARFYPCDVRSAAAAEAVQRHVGSSCAITYKPLPQDDPKVRRPDIGRARQVLGWEPRVSFDEGMRRTIAAFRQQI